MTSHTLSYYVLEPVRRVFRLALLQWFGLSKWHLASAENKPYIKDIVAYVNTLPYQSVCELGCGLGDILSRLKMPEKYGFDVNPRVIRVAKILTMFRRAKATYAVLSVTAENLPSLKTDVWILVNWTHEIEPAELRSIVQNILGQHTTDDGCLIIDSVPPGIGRYQHDPGSLVAGMECSVCRLGGDYPFDRALYVITRGERPVQSA